MAGYEDPGFDDVNLSVYANLLPPPDAPLIEVRRVPNGVPSLNYQFDRTYTPAHVSTVRSLFRSYMESPAIAEPEIVGRPLATKEVEEAEYAYGEIQANAQRLIRDPRDPSKFVKDPKSPRIATGAYLWVVKMPRTRIPILLLGAGDNERKTNVYDGRDPAKAETGWGLDSVRRLAHAVLVAPVAPAHTSKSRKPEYRTRKAYIAAFVLDSQGLSRPEQIAVANLYADRLGRRGQKE